MKRPAASGRATRRRAASGSEPGSSRLRSAKRTKLAAMPTSKYKEPVNLNNFRREAKRVGFDAKEYLTQGYTVLKVPVLTEAERSAALAVARRVREGKTFEFVSMRGKDAAKDTRVLFALLNKYVPFLHQLFSGIQLPGSNWAPYAHHNLIQVALKKPGFEGYGRGVQAMRSSSVGHIDQPLAKQRPEGKNLCNYSALFGIVLNGSTADRDDAGNLYVAPGTHKKYAQAFQNIDDTPKWYKNMESHYLDHVPTMKAVRAKPGQAILMHHQTMHGVGPNCSEEDRVNIYFRLTAAGRPNGKRNSYPEAMVDICHETPLLRRLAELQR